MLISETEEFQRFFTGYLVCAMWTSHNDEDKSAGFDGKTDDDISEEAREVLRAHALSYYSRVRFYVRVDDKARPFAGDHFWQLGHDFWLDQNGHGAGAQDGHWPTYGDIFYRVAANYPETDLFINDDGEVDL